MGCTVQVDQPLHNNLPIDADAAARPSIASFLFSYRDGWRHRGVREGFRDGRSDWLRVLGVRVGLPRGNAGASTMPAPQRKDPVETFPLFWSLLTRSMLYFLDSMSAMVCCDSVCDSESRKTCRNTSRSSLSQIPSPNFLQAFVANRALFLGTQLSSLCSAWVSSSLRTCRVQIGQLHQCFHPLFRRKRRCLGYECHISNA